MTQHRNLDYGQRLPESWVDAIQEFISTLSSPNFKLELATSTSLRVPAGTGNDQVTIGVQGRWRFNTANVTAAHPGGGAGTYDVYVTASDNDFLAGDPETDNTVYSFGLSIRAAASPPATALYRKVATVTWSGTAITSITPLIGGQIPSGYLTSDMILDGTILPTDLSFDPATQTELDAVAAALVAHAALTTSAHGGIVADSDSRLTDSRTPTGAASGDLAGTFPGPKVKQASETFALIGVVTPSNIATSQNDYNPASLSVAAVLRLNATSAVNLTGLAGGSIGRLLVVHVIPGSSSITLKNENTSSSAANRFSLPGDIVVRAGQRLLLQYDSTLSRWVAVGAAAATPTFVGCQLYTSTDVFLHENSAAYTVVWDGEDVDTNGFHTGSDTTIVIPSGAAGTYEIEARIALGDKAVTWVGIRVNGSYVVAQPNEADSTATLISGLGNAVIVRVPKIDLAQGDVIDVVVKNTSGGNDTTVLGRANDGGVRAKSSLITLRQIAA